MGGVALLVGTANRLRDEYLSFNPRAASSEGKTWSRCLSADQALQCAWQGWVAGAVMDRHCPGMPCDGRASARYALRRVSLDDGRVGVVARCVRDYPLGDTWLGVGGEALHCVDMTWERTSRGSDDGRGLRAADPRCAVVEGLPEP